MFIKFFLNVSAEFRIAQQFYEVALANLGESKRAIKLHVIQVERSDTENSNIREKLFRLYGTRIARMTRMRMDP